MTFLIGILWERVKRHQIWFLIVLSLTTLVLGAVLFAWTEGVNFFTALYWAVTTATTVGYGDVTPHNSAGRLVAMGVMLTTIPLVGAIFATWAAILASVQIRRILGMEHRLNVSNHLVVYGYNDTIAHLLTELVDEKQDVVLVADVDPASVPARIHLLVGDPTKVEMVKKANPEKARQALIAGNSDGDILMTAVLVKHAAPQLPQMAMVQSAKVALALQDLGVNHTIAADDLMGRTLAKSLETAHAADLLLGLIGSDKYQLRERPVQPTWVGQTLSQVRMSYAGLLLGLVQDNQVLIGIGHDPVVGAHDAVLLLVPEP